MSFFRGWRRVALAAVVSSACAAPILLAGGGTALASGSCPPGSDPGNPYCQRIPTKIIAQPVIPAGLFATLERADTGAPLRGQTLIFSAGSTILCVTTTDAHGNASCTSLLSVLAAVLNLGYTVTYLGDSTYAPSQAHGPLLSLLGIVIGPGLTVSASSHDSLSHVQRIQVEARLHEIGRARLIADLRWLRTHHSKHLPQRLA